MGLSPTCLIILEPVVAIPHPLRPILMPPSGLAAKLLPDPLNFPLAFSIVAIPGGMASVRTSISMWLDLPDGRVMILETALHELTRVVTDIQD